MERGLKQLIKPNLSLVPAVRTADANGTGVDVLGYGSVEVEFHVGAIGDTLSGSVYVEMEVQHSDDNSAWSACADADITDPTAGTSNTGTVKKAISTAGDQNATYRTGYRGNKRYVRGVWNITGTHSTG